MPLKRIHLNWMEKENQPKKNRNKNIRVKKATNSLYHKSNLQKSNKKSRISS